MHTEFWQETLKETIHLEHIYLKNRIFLKRIKIQWESVDRIYVNQDMDKKRGDVHTIIRLHKMKGISRLYEELLTFQEEKCCMELRHQLTYLHYSRNDFCATSVRLHLLYILYYSNYYNQRAFLTYGLIQKRHFRISYSMYVCVRCGVVSCPVVYCVTVTAFFFSFRCSHYPVVLSKSNHYLFFCWKSHNNDMY